MKKQDKLCIFKVTLDLENLKNPTLNQGVNQKIRESGKAPWRLITIPEDQNLYNFAKIITQNFGFRFDHCFGFCKSSGDSVYDSEEVYVLFNDLEDVRGFPQAEGVKDVKITQAFQETEQLLFHFDYGDNWYFHVELENLQEIEEEEFYPVLLEKSGPNPKQYPPLPSRPNSN